MKAVIQLSPKGEMNGGSNYRDAKRRGIYLALLTDLRGIVVLVLILPKDVT